jgi:hypothetical protein
MTVITRNEVTLITSHQELVALNTERYNTQGMMNPARGLVVAPMIVKISSIFGTRSAQRRLNSTIEAVRIMF